MKYLYILLFVLPLIGFGQGWEQTFGGIESDIGYSVQQTLDGGYVITGNTGSFGNGNSDVYLIKTDENGEEEWSQTLGGTGDDSSQSVQQTLDGGYIITGNTNSFGNGNSDVYLIKTDGEGNEQWSQTFGGTFNDYGKSVQQTLDGGYIITGFTNSFGNGSWDVYLIKIDENGDEQWYQTFGGIGVDEGFSVQQNSDGGYIITGRTGGSFGNNNYDVYQIKTDENGDEQWYQTFGGTGNDWGRSVQQTEDGGYITTGYTESFGNGSYDVYLIKTDENGDEQWYQTFGGTGNDRGWSVQQNSDGGYIITGQTDSFGNYVDVYLIKTDENGDEQWYQTFGGTDVDSGYSVQQTTDGGYIITGRTDGSNDIPYDIYLIKTDSEGNTTFTSTIELPTPTSKRELVKTTNILGQENTTIKNQPMIEIYDDGSVEKKYIID